MADANQSSTPFPGPDSPQAHDPVATGLNFYRDPRRVAVLTFLAGPFYTIWWWWQLFTFAQREKFPRARAFWWILVPFYGLVVLYRILDDLKKAAPELPRVRAFNPGLVITLFIVDNVIGRVFSRSNSASVVLISFVVASLMAATATYLTRNRPATTSRAGIPMRSLADSPGEKLLRPSWVCS
ncbi:MAG: hypothetical protein M3Z11_10785 [Candidatus Dormibacteraeota bacterium]|nr:hypothetical protein [Candidatus Dormibacteraeota bacterium]